MPWKSNKSEKSIYENLNDKKLDFNQVVSATLQESIFAKVGVILVRKMQKQWRIWQSGFVYNKLFTHAAVEDDAVVSTVPKSKFSQSFKVWNLHYWMKYLEQK